MHLVTSYFLVRRLPGAIQLGSRIAKKTTTKSLSCSSSSSCLSSKTFSGASSSFLQEEDPHSYHDAFQKRQFEYLFSLWRNTQHPDVEAVHLLVEGIEAYWHLRRHVFSSTSYDFDYNGGGSAVGGKDSPTSPHRPQLILSWTPTQLRKVFPILRHAAPTYKDLFGYSAQLLPYKLVMVCNADVYLSTSSSASASLASCVASFSPSPLAISTKSSPSVHHSCEGHGGKASNENSSPSIASFFFEKDEPPPVAFALTRHEQEVVVVDQEGRHDHHLTAATAPLIHDYRGSHDAFLLRPSPHSPLHTTSFLDRIHHRQNCYQAENVVLYELQQAGYTVLNPCIGKNALRLIHCHAEDTGVRQWFPSVDPERYARSSPITMEEAVKIIQSKRNGI